jgi:hypothetical protein
MIGRRLMRLRALIAIALACSAFAATASADGTSKKGAKSKPKASQSPSECVAVRTEAIYAAYGYDHHVYLRNGCDKAVRCEVTTNSNPEPTTVTLQKSESQDIVMFRGSPASELSANTKCAALDD